ncbi:hypothetical protein [Lactovum odontotermitis]
MTNENRVRHLEMIQSVITRMSSNSFIIKGWSVAGVGALFMFWLNKNDKRVLFIILGITSIAWFLDAYYLRLERAFRNCYDEVRMSEEDENFLIKPIYRKKEGRLRSAVSPIFLASYLVIIIFTVILIVFTK